jgi:5-methyltetrahydrofolate--homocysteine methyltransferase
MNDLRKRIANGRRLILDGAMGTELSKRGLSPGPEWNEKSPATVTAVHRAYCEAGADILISNTLVANRIHLVRAGHTGKGAAYNRLGVQLAREAAGPDGFVLGDISSSGELLEPYGSLSASEAEDVFSEQAAWLHDAGVDGFIVETITDPHELVIAVRAIKGVSAKPIIASLSFDEGRAGYRTAMGATVAGAVGAVSDAGPDVIGINCGTIDPAGAAAIVGEIQRTVSLPICAQPNGGKPVLEGGTVVFRLAPAAFGEGMLAVARAGAQLLGGCCGTTPAHIAALCEALRRAGLRE